MSVPAPSVYTSFVSTLFFSSFPTLKNGSFFGRTSTIFPVFGFLPAYALYSLTNLHSRPNVTRSVAQYPSPHKVRSASSLLHPCGVHAPDTQSNELPRSKLRGIQNGKERSKLRGILPEEIKDTKSQAVRLPSNSLSRKKIARALPSIGENATQGVCRGCC